MIDRVLRVLATGVCATAMLASAAFGEAASPPEPPPPAPWLPPMAPAGFFGAAAGFFGPPPLFGPLLPPGPLPDARGARPTPRDICLEGIAREAAFRGYLEAKMNLTSAQRPFWQRVDEAGKVAAEAKRELCTKLPATADARRPPLPQAMTMQQDLLAAQLAELQQIQPAMAALYDALSPEQRASFDPPGLP